MNAVVFEIDPEKFASYFDRRQWPLKIKLMPECANVPAFEGGTQVAQRNTSQVGVVIIDAFRPPIRPEALPPNDLKRLNRRNEVGLLYFDRQACSRQPR